MMTNFDKWYALSELNTSAHTPKELMDEAFQAGAGLGKPKWQNLGIDEIRKAAHKYADGKEKKMFMRGVLWAESRLKVMNDD
jgi:hypothetical protein